MYRNRNLEGAKLQQKEESKRRVSARKVPQPVTSDSPASSTLSSNVTNTFASDVSPRPAVRKSKRLTGQLMTTGTRTPTAAARADRLFRLMITPKPEMGRLSEKNYAANFDFASSDRKLRKHGHGPKGDKVTNYASNYKNPRVIPTGYRRNEWNRRGIH